MLAAVSFVPSPSSRAKLPLSLRRPPSFAHSLACIILPPLSTTLLVSLCLSSSHSYILSCIPISISHPPPTTKGVRRPQAFGDPPQNGGRSRRVRPVLRRTKRQKQNGLGAHYRCAGTALGMLVVGLDFVANGQSCKEADQETAPCLGCQSFMRWYWWTAPVFALIYKYIVLTEMCSRSSLCRAALCCVALHNNNPPHRPAPTFTTCTHGKRPGCRPPAPQGLSWNTGRKLSWSARYTEVQSEDPHASNIFMFFSLPSVLPFLSFIACVSLLTSRLVGQAATQRLPQDQHPAQKAEPNRGRRR